MILKSDSNIQYRRLFETARDGILLLDFDTGEIEDVNPYLIEMLGFAKTDFLGKQLWEIGAIVDRDASIKALAELKREGYIKYDDLPLRRGDGELIHVEFVSNVYDVGGQRVIQCNVRDVTDRMRAEHELLLVQESFANSINQIVDVLTKMIVARDPYTYQHQRRVADLSVAIAKELELPPDLIEGLKLIALIHDIGKVSVPLEILTKPTALEPYEVELLRSHVRTGYQVVKDVDSKWPIAEGILQHHERLDGSGYPNGIRGDAIILEARIIAVADTVEAMGTNRPYRKSLGLEAALSEIEAGKGLLFDAAVVDACLRLFREKRYAFSEDS